MSAERRLGRVETIDLLEASGVRPSKSLGQNFVVDPNLTERVAWVAGVGTGDHVLEVGPGLGALTLVLDATGANVTAVEIDARLAEVLATTLPSDVRVVCADALEIDVGDLYEGTGIKGGIVVVGNLPYNVATPLVMRLLESAPLVCRLVVMVQREVADRFAVSPGSKIYGAVSARIAYFAATQLAMVVPPEVFYPKPNVTSAVIEITRRPSPAVDPDDASYDEIVTLLRHGFGNRRKMLRSLAGLVTAEVFAAAGVAPTSRAEELGIDEWGELAKWRRLIAKLAFAKVTGTLRVTGRRSDGYHLLSSEMVAVDLADEVWIDENGDGLTLDDEIAWIASELSRPRFEVPADGANLVAKALALCGRTAAVRLVKRIPAGAGLGGGSSDAAAVIRHFGGVSDEIAASLGADVPFCVAGGRALVSGIGEEIEALPDESLNFVIVTPSFPVSTKAVYDAYDELGRPSLGGSNDLEAAALVVEPRLAGVRRAIAAAAGRAPTLAGSGASYFLECSAFDQVDLARELRAALAGAIGPVVVSPCRSVARTEG